MKRFLALLIAIMMVFAIPSNAWAAETAPYAEVPSALAAEDEDLVTASDLYIMATYYDTDFYSLSLPKQIYLENACIQISYRCVTSDGSYDAMHITITDLNGRGYDKYIDMAGDGATHTMYLYLPAGYYGVQLDGNFKLHTRGAINFKGYA